MPRSTAPAPRRETIFYQNQPIEYTLHFRARRSIGFSVKPDGSVHVAAPAGVPLSWVAAQVERRAEWILKHQAAFRLRPPVATAAGRDYSDGTQHFFQGESYTLRFVESAKPAVTIEADEIIVAAQGPTEAENQLSRWYRQQAPVLFAESLQRVWPRFAEFKLPIPTLSIRLMRTRWGSCSHRTGRIRLNVDLVRAAPECLDYVLLHECCHLLVPDHSARFYELQTRLLPDWERWKKELNALPK